MVDVGSIVKLAIELSKVPETVNINRGQCQLLVDRIDALAGHLQRMQSEDIQEQLEKSHKILHLEIDYHSLKKQSIRAEVADVAHMEEQLSNIASNVQKLENSVTAISEESKRQHNDIMTALKNVRTYRQTLGQDQLSAWTCSVVAIAREESMDREDEDATAASASGIDAEESPPSSTRGKGLEAGNTTGFPGSKSTGSETRVTPVRPPKPNAVGKKSTGGSTPGPSLHLKPFSQSYGVGLASDVMSGGWLADVGLANEATAGEGGAKRGEYEVSFGEGQMGMSLKNVEGRAEVSKICFIRGQGATLSPGGNVKKSHASTWASNAVTAGVSHPAGDKGVLREIYAKASFSQNPWVRSLGWDSLPLPDEGTSDRKDGIDSGEEGAEDLSRWSGVRTGRGNIPDSLRYLRKLTKVDLAYNLLEGSVPGGDARWINSMSILLLNNNKLSGHIPSTLGRLVNLTQLDLAYNNLSGTIPSELSTAHLLEVLSLANNALSGSIPKSFSTLTKLKLFNASNNKVQGSLPQGLGLLTSLEVLSLAHNEISGSIPDDCLSSPSLVSVDLSFNNLQGKIPNSVGAYLANLTELNLSKNSIIGELPSNIGGASKLKKLNLEKNMIEGALPTSIAECKAFQDLNLANNLIMGPLLHIHWGELSNLQHLLLANNKLEGALPASFGSLSSLVSLDISKNQLAGNIPRELHDLTGLKLLDLSGNKIAAGLLPRTSFFSEKRALKKKLSACDVRF
eukprot:g17953.t1